MGAALIGRRQEKKKDREVANNLLSISPRAQPHATLMGHARACAKPQWRRRDVTGKQPAEACTWRRVGVVARLGVAEEEEEETRGQTAKQFV